MKLKRIKREHGDYERGFSRWIRPVMRSYKMACCDCGLVHELQFYAVKAVKFHADGSWGGKLLPRSVYRVMFRARRAERYTAAQRKRKK